MKHAPLEIDAEEFLRVSLEHAFGSGSGTLQSHPSGLWMMARGDDLYWSSFHRLGMRFKLAWKVFTGRADVLTNYGPNSIDDTEGMNSAR